MTDHYVRVLHEPHPNVLLPYRAECTCGYRSQPRVVELFARRSADAHAHTVGGSVQVAVETLAVAS